MNADRRARMWILTAMMMMVVTTVIVGAADHDRTGEESERSRAAITGSWLVTITLPGGQSFNTLQTYGEDGALIVSSQGSVITGPFPFPHFVTAVHGQWKHRHGRTFSTTGMQIGSDLIDGHLLFVHKFRQTVTVNRSGNAYQAVFKSEYFDPDGNLLFAFEGTSEASRIRVEALN
jgi:hypothetical protein